MTTSKGCLQYFKQDVSHISIPEKFTFPFYYEPHELTKVAAKEVQQLLENLHDWDHDFGVNRQKKGSLGKMMGVLVVKDSGSNLGYLVASSGKLNGSKRPVKLVPPVFDVFGKDNFFDKNTLILNDYNRQILELESNKEIKDLKNRIRKLRTIQREELDTKKRFLKKEKEKRNLIRTDARDNMLTGQFEFLKSELAKKSIALQLELKRLKIYQKSQIVALEKELKLLLEPIEKLKTKRRQLSNEVQDYIFTQFDFLNKEGNRKNLLEIFENTTEQKPPSGAGECAAPKLLQYAFQNELTPVCMGEFWWGIEPSSQVRKHKQFYPACRGKCEPILGHMLQGIEMNEDKIAKQDKSAKNIKIVYQDEYLVVINKPEELLSVPGRTIEDSVWLRMKNKFPNASGPLIVHRLDMSTSGVMLIALDKESHKRLQEQFIKRKVKKTYKAVLEGEVLEDEGFINLPLCLDYYDRPRQMVSQKHGKPARTRWKKIAVQNGTTRIAFYPITGRTHQLRVHAAHHLGLGKPIKGDDLYGSKTDRLYLHAEELEFLHPSTGKKMNIKVPADF